MSSWTNCEPCGEEFQVIGGGLDAAVSWCPFCGEPIETEEDEIEEEEEE